MTTRVAIALVLLAVAALVAWRLQRGRRAAPVRDAYPVPTQLDRADFPRPQAPWLVALFSAARCESCRGIPEQLAALESESVATAVVADEERRDLHRRYAISGIPTVVVADAEGVVRESFVGPVAATDLWTALATARERPDQE